MRETTIGHDFVGPAVLECKTEEIGKIDEIYRRISSAEDQTDGAPDTHGTP
jgi:hypothetical protein